MRDVVLVPEHSQWWLLSPGVTLYYDRLLIYKSDYEEVINAVDKSSYHTQVAQHLDALVRQGEKPHVQLVDHLKGLQEDYHKRGEIVRDQLYAAAMTPNNPMIQPKDVLRLTLDAFSHWIAHNERKVKYLRKDEPYRKYLEAELLGEWRDRKRVLAEMLKLRDDEVLDQFRANKKVESTFTRLMASASRCIDLVDAGAHIYDPMLVQYLPAIAVIERLRRTADFQKTDRQSPVLFNAYHLHMPRYGDVVPLRIRMSEMRRFIDQYRAIRAALERVDETLKAIDVNDPAAAFEEAHQEIAPLVKEARRAARRVEYGFWAVGLISSLASILISSLASISGLPPIVGAVADRASALALLRRNVGRFAGAYALVAEAMILGQRTLHAAEGYPLDYDYFRRHYLDFADRTTG